MDRYHLIIRPMVGKHWKHCHKWLGAWKPTTYKSSSKKKTINCDFKKLTLPMPWKFDHHRSLVPTMDETPFSDSTLCTFSLFLLSHLFWFSLVSMCEISISTMHFNSLTLFSFHFCFVVAVPQKSKSDFWSNPEFLSTVSNLEKTKTFLLDTRYIKLNLAAFLLISCSSSFCVLRFPP